MYVCAETVLGVYIRNCSLFPDYVRLLQGFFSCSAETTPLLPAQLAEQLGELADMGRLKGLVQGAHTVPNSELVPYPADSPTLD